MLCLLSINYGARAAEESEPELPEGQLPDIELLEFLGSFETDDGDWINPNDLVEVEFGLLLETALEDSDDTENQTGSEIAKPGSN